MVKLPFRLRSGVTLRLPIIMSNLFARSAGTMPEKARGHKFDINAKVFGQPFGHIDLKANVFPFLSCMAQGTKDEKPTRITPFFDNLVDHASIVGGLGRHGYEAQAQGRAAD